MSTSTDLAALIAQLSEANRQQVRNLAEQLWREQQGPESAWTFDFIGQFAQAKVSAQRDGAGMEIKIANATCGGVTRPALWEHPPLVGNAIVSYAVPIPSQLRGVKLRFAIGIRDGAELPADRYVAFRVTVNGWKLWSVIKNSRHWEEYQVKMPELASDVVVIEYITDGMGDHRWNWAVWGEPRLISD